MDASMFNKLGEALVGGMILAALIAIPVIIGLWELLKWLFVHIEFVWK